MDDPVIINLLQSPNASAWNIWVDNSNSSGTNLGNILSYWLVPESSELEPYLNTSGDKTTFNLLKWFLMKNGTGFQCGRYYRITLAVTNPCTQWVSDTRVIYFDCCMHVPTDDTTTTR